MIKNIIFDMGGVIVEFNPELFMDRYSLNSEDRKIIRESIFRSIEWVKLDRGTMEEEQAIQIFENRLPAHLKKYARIFTSSWDNPLMLIEGMEKLIYDLKQSGYHIYLLSNASTRQPEYWKNVPASKYFDDTCISCDHKLLKPDTRLYLTALDQFEILPEESMFIDDSSLNVESAETLGIKGFVFNHDADELRRFMISNSIQIPCSSE